jgi:LacI family transcriptional regulator
VKTSPVPSRPRSQRRPAATIREVARAAGVSVATVSRALNDKGPLREETRRRVRRAAERLHYIPHGGARSLITRRTHTLGVLLPDIFGEFFSELIRGIDVTARRRGYHVLVSGFHGHRSETRAMLRAMRGRVDGLIVLAPDLPAADLERNLPVDLPVVLVNGAPVGRHGSIGVDNFRGALAVARHMVSEGHESFAIVTGPPGNRDAAERLRGYRQGLGPARGRRAIVIRGDFREETGYRAVPRILAEKRRPSAVLAANDAMAIGVLCALQERGVAVPDDIALAGFDDIPIARFVNPPLTTVRVPITDLGARAAARLLAGVEESHPLRPAREMLPATLVVRASSRRREGAPETGLAIPWNRVSRRATRDSTLRQEGAR